MIILHISGVKQTKANGVAKIVMQYVFSQSKTNNVALYDISNKYEDGRNIKVYNCEKYNKISELPSPFSKPELVVFHETYKPKYLKLYKECIKNNIPYIIIPHGSLTKYAQNNKRLKKMFGNLLFFNNFLTNAKKIQYVSESEAQNSAFPKLKYIVLGNGIEDIPQYNKYLKKNKTDKFRFIYIGRYDYLIKGLDQLLKACSIIKSELINNNAVIELYGIGTQKNLELINNDIDKYNLHECVIVNGPVYGLEKQNILLKSDIFIQTSRSEGQPLGVMEAMSLGMPVLLTKGTGFEKIIKENNCGILTECEYKKISDALIKAINSSNKLDIMSNNSYNYAINNFEWNSIVEKSLKEYKKVID